MPQETIDFIMDGQGHGSVAQRLLANGMNVNALRTNATLCYDEWKQIDEAILKAAQPRLVGVGDLLSRGLEYNIGNGLATTVLQYEDASDMTDAELSMDGITKGQKDRLDLGIKYLPLPIVHKDFSLNVRALMAGRKLGQPIDTMQSELSSIKVADKIETILFRGSSSYTFGGGVIYGYCDFPSRNTYTIPLAWDSASKTGALILVDVLAMKQKSIDDLHLGPWILYVPTAYESCLDSDFKTYGGQTIRQRILAIDGIQDVKVSTKLAANNVVLAEMNAGTVRMITGMPLTNVEWQSEGNMQFNFKVMSIQVPQLRANQDGKCGIVHGSV